MYDVTIIGAGVAGSSVARELSRYKLKVCVIEKNPDVADGTSKANSGIVHGGHDAKPNTLKAKLNVLGNGMFDLLSKELDFPFKRNGSLVLCFDKDDICKLERLKAQGLTNGVKGLTILDSEKVHELEPNISDAVVAALYVPSGGIVCPYEMTVALAENAHENGVEFIFNVKVDGIEKQADKFLVSCNERIIETRLLVNAAGLYSDDINNMVSSNKIKIIPVKGEYCLFDKVVGGLTHSTIFQLPTAMGKGVLITPTVDRNLLIGPNAVIVSDKEDVTTTKAGIDEILQKAKISIKSVPTRFLITSFAGIRAHLETDDFLIEEASDVPNFINIAGIESPGLTSAPAIGKMVGDLIKEKLSLEVKDNFNPIRHGIPRFRELSNEKRRELIRKDSSYGKIICRCESVTEGEILNAIRRPLGARTIDSIKRRTRAGMGRCQSGFCITKIVDILTKELNISPEEITKDGGNSKLIFGRNKQVTGTWE